MRKTLFKSIRVTTSVSLHSPFNNCSHVEDVITSEIETQSLKWNGQDGAGAERYMKSTKRQQEITVFFPAARSYTRFLAKRHIFCPRFQSVFVFCLVFTFTIITTAAASKQGPLLGRMWSPGPDRLHSSQAKPGRSFVGFALTWMFSVWGFDFSDSRVSLERSAATQNSTYQEWAKSFLSRLPTLLDTFSSFLHFFYLCVTPIASASSCCPPIC